LTAAPLTVQRRLGPGAVLRTGSAATYRAVAEIGGEPHTIRTDLVGPLGREVQPARRDPLVTIGHVTDLHVTDAESPARFEFINRMAGDPRYREFLPMHRPQEALNAHTIDAMVRTLNGIDRGPVAGAPLDLVVMSGDAIDNAQLNELANFIALFDGGRVQPGSGGPEFESVQAPGWPDDLFWKPDGGAHGRDQFRLAYGFPHLPGLFDRGLRAFNADGLRVPWIGCRGNHELLCQGVGIVTPELAAALVAGRKPIALPDGIEAQSALETFVTRPQAFMGGPTISVTPDAARRPAGPGGVIEAHFGSEARPPGHGFTDANRHEGSGDYVHDTRAERFITLDTTCTAGGADGCISREQLRWLDERLQEVAGEDRLVILVTHHPLFTIRNPRVGPDHATADELESLLLRFKNVVLWLNGHIHSNLIHAHAGPAGSGTGFWEVTTCSLVDWPCQSRMVEVYDAGEGLLAIACTMVDHDGAVDPGEATTSVELAGLHRQLAGNDPMAGFGTSRIGDRTDRNVILLLRAPFALG
jgi:metallophosphoesterase (TIGR03767 family)